jgi:hypothetical protein
VVGVVGGWLQIHQPQVLPPYFAARKKNPGLHQFCKPSYSHNLCVDTKYVKRGSDVTKGVV